jgi:transposase
LKPQLVRSGTTAELKAMAEWLKQCKIRTVAMQSTGVYWITVYDILEAAGFEVYFVNARETKNQPGRKSDVQESQWLMKLHTYGLLRNSFRPSQEIRRLRTFWRQRNDLVQAAGRHIQRMQKALTQMNIQLANVLSDVSGMTGQAIIEAILAGERDPHKLAEFRDPRVKASQEQIARSLEGNWQEDLLFVLKQEQESYEFCQKQMAECDRRLQQYLQQRADRSQGAALPEEKRKGRLKKKRGNAPQFDLRTELFRMTGTDLTQIDSIDVMTVTTILSEVGWDISKWATEDHFVSWLRLCPDNRISGEKIIGKGRLPTKNRASIALKMAASTLRVSNTYLGAQFRRFRTRLGAPIAIKAMAAKLARLVSHAALRNQVRGPRCEVLRGPTSRSTDQTAQVESCQARISSRPTSCSLKRRSFWGAKSRFPDLLETLVVGSNGWSGWNRVRCFASRRSQVRTLSRPSTSDGPTRTHGLQNVPAT